MEPHNDKGTGLPLYDGVESRLFEFIGFNIFAIRIFTALSNGIVSAVLAFSRSFVFMLVIMIVLPLIRGVNGIWLATPAVELMALGLSVFMFLKYRKRYGY